MHATMQATKIIVERRFPLDLRQSISSIRELYETGKLRPVIDRLYPLEQTAEAHRYVDTGRKKGNVIVTM